MIKILRENFQRAENEFKKGNNCWLAICKGNDDLRFFIIIKDIVNKNDMVYSEYSGETMDLSVNNQQTNYNGWNFQGFHFYILNRKEIAPYLKKIICASLEKIK